MSMASLNPDLIRLEARTGLGPTKAAKLLGVHYTAYAGYRSGRRPWPIYHQYHVKDLINLDDVRLRKTIQERVWQQE